MKIYYFITDADDEQVFESTDKDAVVEWFKNKDLDDYQVVMHWQDADDVYFDAELIARNWMLEELRKEILIALELESTRIIDETQTQI